MAQITPSRAALTGTTLTANAASAGGDSIANLRGGTFLQVINGSGASINCTLAAAITSRGGDATYPPQTVANNVVAVGAGVTKLIGPIPAAYNDGNGNVQVTWSATSSVTFHAIDPSSLP
jgi:hypothetical protein